MEEVITISTTGILLAAFAHFILGFIWYTPLFGKVWATEMGINFDDKPKTGAMIKGMVLNLTGCLLMAFVFTHNLDAWDFVMEKTGFDASITHRALMGAFFTWLGFYVPTDLNLLAWEGKSFKLFLINTVYHFLGLAVAAQILVRF
ncbi:MAG: DUF1761 domain-containing protein [Bacteroidetes bacterium]|nr:DUF1761 domain-containing protein [Bacteroidota bacterium]